VKNAGKNLKAFPSFWPGCNRGKLSEFLKAKRSFIALIAGFISLARALQKSVLSELIYKDS